LNKLAYGADIFPDFNTSNFELVFQHP